MIRKITPYLIIVVFAVIFFSPLLKQGYLIYSDNPVHHFELDYLANRILPEHNWVNGWCMQAYLGYPVLLYQPQLGFWLTIILSKVSPLSLAISYKAMILCALAFLGCGMYTVLAPRFGKQAGFFISLLIMLQKNIYYEKILAGMWNNYLAIGCFLIFFHLLDKWALSLTIKRSVLLGLLFGTIILTHLYTAIFASLLILAYLLPVTKKRTGIFLIPVIGTAVSLFYILPYLETGWYFRFINRPKSMALAIAWTFKGFLGGFERFFSLSQLQTGQYQAFFQGFLRTIFINYAVILRLLFGVLGICIFWIRRRIDYPHKKFLFVTAMLTFFALVIYSDILYIIPNWGTVPLIGGLQAQRFLIYAQLGLMIFAAFGIFKFFEWLKKGKRTLLLSALILLFISAFIHQGMYVNPAAKTFEEVSVSRHLKDLWSWVSENINQNESRILYQSTLLNSKDPILALSNIISLSGLYCNAGQIGAFSGATPYPSEAVTRTDEDVIFKKKLYDTNDTEIAHKMQELNCRFAVSSGPVLKEMLSGSGLFVHKEAFGPFSVFVLRNFKSSWVEFKYPDTRFKMVRFDDQFLRFNIENSRTDNRAKIRIAYHPYWKCRLNEIPVDIFQDEDGIMEIPLEEKGTLDLQLRYNSQNKPVLLTSLASLMLALGILVFKKKKND